MRTCTACCRGSTVAPMRRLQRAVRQLSRPRRRQLAAALSPARSDAPPRQQPRATSRQQREMDIKHESSAVRTVLCDSEPSAGRANAKRRGLLSCRDSDPAVPIESILGGELSSDSCSGGPYTTDALDVNATPNSVLLTPFAQPPTAAAFRSSKSSDPACAQPDNQAARTRERHSCCFTESAMAPTASRRSVSNTSASDNAAPIVHGRGHKSLPTEAPAAEPTAKRFRRAPQSYATPRRSATLQLDGPARSLTGRLPPRPAARNLLSDPRARQRDIGTDACANNLQTRWQDSARESPSTRLGTPGATSLTHTVVNFSSGNDSVGWGCLFADVDDLTAVPTPASKLPFTAQPVAAWEPIPDDDFSLAEAEALIASLEDVGPGVSPAAPPPEPPVAAHQAFAWVWDEYNKLALARKLSKADVQVRADATHFDCSSQRSTAHDCTRALFCAVARGSCWRKQVRAAQVSGSL